MVLYYYHLFSNITLFYTQLQREVLGANKFSAINQNLSQTKQLCEQTACEKAASQPEYVCDYIVGFFMLTPSMPSFVDAYISNGDYGQGRFVNTDDGWLFIPMSQ